MQYLLGQKRKVLLLTLITLLTLPVMATARPGPGPHHAPPDAPPPFEVFAQQNEQLLRELLSLTEQQQQQIQTLFAEQRKTMELGRKQLEDIHQRLRAQLDAEQLDEALVRSLLKQEAEIKAEEMISFHRQEKQLASILSKKQREKAETLRRMLPGKCGPEVWF